MNTKRFGDLGERIAEAFLVIKGYEIVARNYRFAGREIDIVARHGDALVAVEVKLRRGNRFGSAAQAIDSRKLSRIRTALTDAVRRSDARFARVDVVAIDIEKSDGRMTVEHFVGVC